METEPDVLRDLMRRYAAGEDAAFEQIYRSTAPRLYRFCLCLAGMEADDLLQETFLRMHRSRATYMPGSVVMHWAFAIARSAFLDRRRYWRRRPEQLGATDDVAEDVGLRADESYAPDAQICTDDLLAVMRSALAKMSEKNRSAYLLLKEEGLSAKDAAAVLGTTADVVKQRAHRAYEQLRTAVGTAGWREHVDQADTRSNRLGWGAARGPLLAHARVDQEDTRFEN